jgi:hypothetical protein
VKTVLMRKGWARSFFNEQPRREWRKSGSNTPWRSLECCLYKETHGHRITEIISLGIDMAWTELQSDINTSDCANHLCALHMLRWTFGLSNGLPSCQSTKCHAHGDVSYDLLWPSSKPPPIGAENSASARGAHEVEGCEWFQSVGNADSVSSACQLTLLLDRVMMVWRYPRRTDTQYLFCTPLGRFVSASSTLQPRQSRHFVLVWVQRGDFSPSCDTCLRVHDHADIAQNGVAQRSVVLHS